MTEEELIDKFGNEEIYNKGNYSDFIDRDTMAKNDFYHYKKGYELGIKELETTKEENEKLKANADKCYCAFCCDNIERTWDDLKSHMETCERHPLFITKKELETTKKLLDEAVSMLTSASEMCKREDYIQFMIEINQFLAKLSNEGGE